MRVAGPRSYCGVGALDIIGFILVLAGLTGVAVHFWLARSNEGVKAMTSVASPVLAGRWHGVIQQPGYPSYPAEMQIDMPETRKPVGAMGYPTLGCKSSLTFMRNDGAVFWFRESVTQGRDKCQDGGLIAVAQGANGGISWKYFSPANTISELASSDMTR